MEAFLQEYPTLSIWGGWRYDNLATVLGNKKLPGVGFSIGLSRLVGLLDSLWSLPTGRQAPSRVVITGFDESQRKLWNTLANQLRDSGIQTEAYYDFTKKIGKQMSYASKKQIPYVLILDEDGKVLSLKNITTQEQRTNITIQEVIRSINNTN